MCDEDAVTTDQSDEELNDVLYNRTEDINLKEFNVEDVDENSKYIQISNPDGTTKIVLKSSIVSLLADSSATLSSDRLKRVKSTPLQKTAKRQKTHKNDISQNLVKCSKVSIGHWCAFDWDPESSSAIKFPDNTLKNILIGSVLSFKFIDGRTDKEKQYHLDSATVIDDKTKNNRDDLEVLSSWYAISDLGDARDTLVPLSHQFYLNMKHYKYSTPIPTVTEKKILFIQNICSLINL